MRGKKSDNWQMTEKQLNYELGGRKDRSIVVLAASSWRRERKRERECAERIRISNNKLFTQNISEQESVYLNEELTLYSFYCSVDDEWLIHLTLLLILVILVIIIVILLLA